ncbi:MAG: aminotransferase class I/II-fold pyridoxal phosphate-dependent enzyme [Cellvibrionaceae bacterium]|nr:aminotransferase class I/II-fold pyridoxal phosphate-dependent enzyme [Cellvibrionaceae bacterium]
MNPRYFPLHGGDIVSASAHYGIAPAQWIDLSTGINPQGYTVDLTQISAASLQQLPYAQPAFMAASAAYYQTDAFMPVAGTQAAIQQWPYLLAPLPVLLPSPGYSEYAQHWQACGAAISYYPAWDVAAATAAIDRALAQHRQQHLVVINPNNPSGLQFDCRQLRQWSQQLAAPACLIVDEAFIDTQPQASLLNQTLPANVIVLRSVGKFFGLAGLRLGYCFASSDHLARLQQRLGLWQVNGPAQIIATQALADSPWQNRMRITIADNAAFTRQLFKPLIDKLAIPPSAIGSADLFTSYPMSQSQAQTLVEHFAQAGILLRCIPQPKQRALLRVGLVDKGQAAIVKRVAACVALFATQREGYGLQARSVRDKPRNRS